MKVKSKMLFFLAHLLCFIACKDSIIDERKNHLINSSVHDEDLQNGKDSQPLKIKTLAEIQADIKKIENSNNTTINKCENLRKKSQKLQDLITQIENSNLSEEEKNSKIEEIQILQSLLKLAIAKINGQEITPKRRRKSKKQITRDPKETEEPKETKEELNKRIIEWLSTFKDPNSDKGPNSGVD